MAHASLSRSRVSSVLFRQSRSSVSENVLISDHTIAQMKRGRLVINLNVRRSQNVQLTARLPYAQLFANLGTVGLTTLDKMFAHTHTHTCASVTKQYNLIPAKTS